MLYDALEQTARKQLGASYINYYVPDNSAIILNLESNAIIQQKDIDAFWLTAIKNGYRLNDWTLETGRLYLMVKEDIIKT